MATAKKAAPKAKLTMNTKTGTIKVAAKGKVVETAPPAATKEHEGPKLPAVYRDGTHSAIVLAIEPKAVTMITMAGLRIEEMRRSEFDSSYELYPDYPVRRCAEIYLGSGQYRQIDPETRERLQAIAADKATEYKPFVQPKEADTMKSTVTKEAKAAPHPLRRASDAAQRAAEKATAAGKPKEAKAPAPSKDAKSTGKAAPAKAAAKSAEKPTAAAKKAPPWDKGGTKPEAAAKKAGGTPPARAPKFDGDTKVKMGDTAKAKRGKMLTFIEAAIELAKKGKGVTTRGAIEAKVQPSWTGDDLNTYFPYAVKNGLLIVA